MFDTSWYDIRWYPFCCFIFLEILWKVPETKVAVLHLRFQLLCPKAFLRVNLGEFSWRQVVWKDSQAFVLDGTALLYEEGGGSISKGSILLVLVALSSISNHRVSVPTIANSPFWFAMNEILIYVIYACVNYCIEYESEYREKNARHIMIIFGIWGWKVLDFVVLSVRFHPIGNKHVWYCMEGAPFLGDLLNKTVH